MTHAVSSVSLKFSDTQLKMRKVSRFNENSTISNSRSKISGMTVNCNLNNDTCDSRARVNNARGLELVYPQELGHYLCFSFLCYCTMASKIYRIIFHPSR